MGLFNCRAEDYVGKQFVIDCIDIEVMRVSDHQPPIFKGPGCIQGNRAGRLTYKVYNQIPLNNYMFEYLQLQRSSNDPKETNVRLKATAYDGTEWIGGWSIPNVDILQNKYSLIAGEFDNLSTRIVKVKGDKKINLTELVFDANFDIPFEGKVKVQHFHDDEVVSTSWWGDHQKLLFEGTPIIFQRSADKKRIHIEAYHKEDFGPPFVENWITEALVFSTARVVHPRMEIRYFQEDALVAIKATPIDIRNVMIPPFANTLETREMYWKSFCAYLSKCKSVGQFENLKMTTGFYELCLASTGTLQGLLIPLSLYIEFCIKEIFAYSDNVECADTTYKSKVNMLLQHVNDWTYDDKIRERAIGILSNLNNPSMSKYIDVLVDAGVLTKTHKQVWKKARPYLAHGNIIDFSKQEEFRHYRNHLFSMMYRLIFRIIGYKGLVLDYNGENFKYVDFQWRDF